MGQYKASNYLAPPTSSQPGDLRSILFDYIRDPACKRLIYQILAAQKEHSIKSIAVLSQFAGEGKTALVSVLALGFMTFLDKRVLILDTVSQTQDESFYYCGVLDPTSNGLDSSSTQRCVDLLTTRSLNRRTLLDPVPTSNNLLPKSLSEELQNFDTADFQIGPFIDSMKAYYDLILLDTCALSLTDKNSFDPLILAQCADTSILLTSRTSLQRGTLATLMRELSRYRIDPMGMVVDSRYGV